MVELYENMLEKSEVIEGRQAEAASYFKFIIDHIDWALYHRSGNSWSMCTALGLSIFVPIYEHFHGKFHTDDESLILSTVWHRIRNLCAGFVVLSGHEVNFFHRTAQDFFREPTANTFLEQSSLTQLECYCLFVDGLVRNGHNSCSGQLGVYETHILLHWCQAAEEMSDADKVKFYQHIDQTMSQHYSLKHGVIKENWVYEQAKSYVGDDQVLDFTSLACKHGSTELLSHYLSTGRRLSRRYKDYLLLILAHQDSPNPDWERNLLTQGANPNATFYWGIQDRLKTSPWLEFLVNTFSLGVKDANGEIGPDTETVVSFLDNGANLDDRTVLLKYFDEEIYFIDPIRSRDLVFTSNEMIFRGETLVIEVNAKYLLEQHMNAFEKSDGREKGFSRHDVQKVESYQRILVIHPGHPDDDASPDPLQEDVGEEFARDSTS
ncbi:hypothetical protein F4801DRAFT_442999 [Xylaria longipes]|nr:hypothetical protein F4801DRAFT_442999 [Xylaria longipes]RYC65538.1 hypothetical protein CHU98_g650 [Xylaria longipes]